jgi:small nuclear ribonucleoprotein
MGRPLDVLEETLGETVTVRLKGGEIHAGALAGYDQHLNVVLDPVAGGAVEGGTGAGPPDATAAEPGHGAADGPIEPVDSTTIIRGDNVVSVTT